MDRRRQVYTASIGLAAGALLTGLVLPMTIDPAAAPTAVGAVPTGGPAGADAESLGAGPSAVAGNDADAGGGDRTPAAGAPAAPGAEAGEPGAAAPTSNATNVDAGGGGASGRSDVGVSDDEIELGVLLFDLAGVGRMGFSATGADAPQQQRFYEAFIADVNDGGGVGGRRLVPTFVTFDPIDSNDQQRACVEVTEDVKPFVALSAGGFFGDPVLCVTEQHATPLISGQGEADEYYQRAGGRLFTPEMSATRMARTMARRAHDQGRLKGATIGLIIGDEPQSRLPGDGGLRPQLEALGYEIAHISRLSDDVSTAQSQIPVEVVAMRRAGVDRILVSANGVLLAVWFNQADGQGYRPLYIVSDVASTANDFTVQSAPRSTSVIAYTVMRQGEARVRRPQQHEAATCQERFRRRTGELVERTSAGYEQLTAICGTVSLFSDAAERAGRELTRSRWAGAMQSSGDLAFPDIGGTISFGPGKFAGADHVRTKEFDGDCRCFLPVDDFVRVP